MPLRARHLWADRFGGSLADIFDLQHQVALGVVGAVVPKVEQAEIERKSWLALCTGTDRRHARLRKTIARVELLNTQNQFASWTAQPSMRRRASLCVTSDPGGPSRQSRDHRQSRRRCSGRHTRIRHSRMVRTRSMTGHSA